MNSFNTLESSSHWLQLKIGWNEKKTRWGKIFSKHFDARVNVMGVWFMGNKVSVIMTIWKKCRKWVHFLPYLLAQREVPLTVPSAAIWRKLCVLPNRRTAILKEGSPAAILLIFGLTVKRERRDRVEKTSASLQATTGSIDVVECLVDLRTAEWQTPKAKITRRTVFCRK